MGGRRTDGVSSYPASEADLALYEAGRQLLARQPKPVLLEGSDPDRRMFFANFDGSGQDMHRPGAIPTNIGSLHADLLRAIDKGAHQVASEYLAGPGTQANPLVRGPDAALGFTVDDRVAEMYRRLARQSQPWLDANPNADITLAATGYSRGAVAAVMLTRLVDRYGILDPEGLRFGRDGNGDLKVESTRPPLVPPRRTAQALLLLDPVSTGIDRDFDLRPPPSVITGVSLWARDDRRGAFAHRAIIDVGLGDDGRFAGILLPGAHSDVGGGNRLNGLEVRAGNLLRQALNGLSDAPLVAERPVPDDPALAVIHRAHQGLWGVFELGSAPAGSDRRRHEELCVVVDPCRDAEPRDEALAARYFTWPQALEAARDPVTLSRLDTPGHPAHALYRAARSGIEAIDRQHGLRPDEGTTRAAAALAAAAQARGMDRIAHVVLGHDRQRLFAVDTEDMHAPHRKIAYVDVVQARQESVEESTRRMDAALAAAVAAAQGRDREHAAERMQAERVRTLAY